MIKHPFVTTLLAAGLLAAAGSHAADVTINGFASIVGGMTTSEGETPSGKNTFEADAPTEGIYDDDISFKPDSNYGIQITGDLMNNLRVIGQLTGAGGEDFEAEVSWAYVSYDLTDTVNLQAGRQRLPLFFYSDFLDVAYAYHWIRVPTVLAAGAVDTFEGAKLSWSPSGDQWDYRFEVYGGAGDESIEQLQGDVNFEKILGMSARASNDWLQLRASYMQSDTWLDSAVLLDGFVDEDLESHSDSDNTNGYTFWGLAAHATFGNGFVVAEFSHAETDKVAGYALCLNDSFGVCVAGDTPFTYADAPNGFNKEDSWYISAGYRIGNLTPHITYGETDATHYALSQGPSTEIDVGSAEWTFGVRWDFHSSAALKAEYTTRSDESDSVYRDLVAGGKGEPAEVDVFAVGIDVVF